MVQTFKLFGATFFLMFICDMLWLGLIAKSLYKESLGFLLRRSGEDFSLNWIAVIVVYMLLTSGILIFVLPKANNHYLESFLFGALFGLVCYGIYDFTNLATLAKWPLFISLIDIVWGTFLCSIISLFACFMRNYLYT